MKNVFVLLSIIGLMHVSCASAPPSCLAIQETDRDLVAGKISTIKPTPATKPQPASQGKLDADIDAHVSNARKSIDSNHLAEGIKFYISALVKATNAGLTSRADELLGTLTEIGTRLTVEPHESWLSPDGSQKSGISREASRGEGLMPAVYLYESYSYAKSPVPDAFIRFEFITNDGTLNASVTTDSKGLANTGISSLQAPGKDAVVRAYPVFSSDGYSFAFKTAFRDFTFVAAPNLALVAVLENTHLGESVNSRVLDSLASSLKPLGVEVVPFNGVLARERFNAAFAGDHLALKSLAGSLKAGYFVLAHVDVSDPTQMEYGGKLYNIYVANAKARLRIVRADGTLVFAEAKDGIKGQGGSKQAAIDDGLLKVRDKLSAIVDGNKESISKAFSE